jgi:hypothetical protein
MGWKGPIKTVVDLEGPDSPGAQPFGGSSTMFANRYDLSVNSARVESAGSTTPLIITGTAVNNAGAFNGGGIGNKAILGCKGHAGVNIADIEEIAWEWTLMSLQPPTFLPYLNLLVSIGGGVKIFSVDPLQATILNTGTLTPLGGGQFRFVTNTATNFVQVVNAFEVAPIISPPVPVAAGTGPHWFNASFRWSDIIASFPGSVLVDVSSGDGGLPKNTVTPAFLLNVGDSGNAVEHVYQMGDITFNGTPA